MFYSVNNIINIFKESSLLIYMFVSHIATTSQINDSADVLNKYIENQLYDKFYTPLAAGDFETFGANYKLYMVERYPLPGIDTSICSELDEEILLFDNLNALLEYTNNKGFLDKTLAAWLGQLQQIYFLNESLKEREECEAAKKAKVTMPELTADIQVSVKIDNKYKVYVKVFGPPVNGVFDPVKLASISDKPADYVTNITCFECQKCECECN